MFKSVLIGAVLLLLAACGHHGGAVHTSTHLGVTHHDGFAGYGAFGHHGFGHRFGHHGFGHRFGHHGFGHHGFSHGFSHH